MNRLILLVTCISIYILPQNVYADPFAAFFGMLFHISSSSTETTESINEHVNEEKKREKFVQDNYLSIAEDVAAGCGEPVDALYDVLDYDEIVTKDLFCNVLKKYFEILFTNLKYNDQFLPTLEDRVNLENNDLLARWEVDRSDVVRNFIILNGCEDVGYVVKIKEGKGFEDFASACSDKSMEFLCSFQGETVYDTKGIPHNKLYISHLKAYRIIPTCFQSDHLGVVKRLAAQNGCDDISDITKTVKEGDIELFTIACSDRSMEFECNFQGDIVYQFDTNIPYYRETRQPVCHLTNY